MWENSVNATLSPSSQTSNLSIGDSPITTSVVISNIGNTPATFSVYLDTTNAGRNSFLETPTVVQIGAGYESTVRVRLNASDDASLAAANYFATVWVSNEESGLNLSANILGNISEQHGIVGQPTPPSPSSRVKQKPWTMKSSIEAPVENILVETTVDGIGPTPAPGTLSWPWTNPTAGRSTCHLRSVMTMPCSTAPSTPPPYAS